MFSLRSRRLATMMISTLAVFAGFAAGCGAEASDEARDAATKPTDTTKEPIEADDQPDPDLEVIPGAGVAGVKVGDSAEDVERVLGAPEDRAKVIGELSGQAQERLRFPDRGIEVVLGDDVMQVETTNSESRTESGVGVGSSLDDVTTAYPDATCDENGEVRICRVGVEEAGEVSTDFFVQDDTVNRIVVGRIID